MDKAKLAYIVEYTWQACLHAQTVPLNKTAGYPVKITRDELVAFLSAALEGSPVFAACHGTQSVNLASPGPSLRSGPTDD